MKKAISICVLCVVMMTIVGCSDIKVREVRSQVLPDGKIIVTLDKTMEYHRKGDQAIDSATFAFDPNKGTVTATLKGQKSKGDIGSNLAATIQSAFDAGVASGKAMAVK